MSTEDHSADAAGAPPSLAIEAVDGGAAIATITLRRPQVANRLEPADLAAIIDHVGGADADPRVRVLRLVAQGRHFCSGFHIGAIDPAAPIAPGARPSDRFEAMADAVENARAITVAAIQGGVYGGAVDLALACDFRIGTPAVQAMVPPARLGLHYHRGGLERFVTRLGLAAAKRLLLGVETLDAAALLQAGGLDRIVAPEALAAETDAFARHLAGLAPLALLPMKRHLNAIARGRLDAEAIAADIARAWASDDLREGSAAWAEKRAPRFSGR
jgi:enoyl-CoA hydratase/carnithine racemase